MKIIITGSRGFIGKNLCENLSKKNIIKRVFFKNLSSKNNLEIKKKIKKIFLSFNPDLVIHVATLFSKEKSYKIEKMCHKVNFENSKILVDTSIECNVKKFIYFGSNHEFEKNKSKLYPYLFSKIKFSKYIKKIQNKETNFLGIYLFNTFGENDKRNKFYSQIIKHPNKDYFINKNLNLNYINVNIITKYIGKILKKDWYFKKKFVCIQNKKNFNLKDLNKLGINLLANKKDQNEIKDDKINIPIKKIIFNYNRNNSLFYFIKKNLFLKKKTS